MMSDGEHLSTFLSAMCTSSLKSFYAVPLLSFKWIVEIFFYWVLWAITLDSNLNLWCISSNSTLYRNVMTSICFPRVLPGSLVALGMGPRVMVKVSGMTLTTMTNVWDPWEMTISCAQRYTGEDCSWGRIGFPWVLGYPTLELSAAGEEAALKWQQEDGVSSSQFYAVIRWVHILHWCTFFKTKSGTMYGLKCLYTLVLTHLNVL